MKPTLLPLRSAVEGLSWPPVQVGPAASIAALASWLDASQWLPPDELTARALEQLVLLARHCQRTSPAFARRLSAAGLTAADLGAVDGLRRLPPITRRDIQLAGPSFYCSEVPKTHQPVGESSTSGSTGEPVTIRRTSVSNAMLMGHGIREQLWFRRNLLAPFAAVRANISVVSRLKDWGPPHNLLFVTGQALALPIGTALRTQAAELRALRPGTLLCYPNNLDALIDELAAGGPPWPELSHLQTIGETLSPRIRDKARNYFGLEIDDLYSAQEVGVIAVQCPDCRQYHVVAETVVVEVVDADGRPCQPGEIGRVLVTDLTNFATPIIRYDIGDYAEAGGPPWPELSHLQTIGETLSPRIRDKARAYFGLEIDDLYSAQEVGVIAVQCPDCRQYHVVAETVVVEVVDADGRPCRPGEIGRVLVTDLTNFATPVIRYDIGDYAELGEPATCGRGLPTLSRIVGRDRNLIVMPDGTRRWPLTGYHRFPEVGPILQFQFIQVDRDTIEAHLVTGRPFDSRDESAFRDIVLEALGHPFKLLVHYHEGALPRGANGKFEDFVCRVVL